MRFSSPFHAGLSSIVALSIAAIFPLVDVVFGVMSSRSISIVGGASLVGILAGLGLAFVIGNALFAILMDSAFSLLFSFLFFGSLATRRPLIFLLARQAGAERAAALDRAWDERPPVRRVFFVMTLA